MNVKTYLMTNSSPLLDNLQNILILEWLEGNSFCTLNDISTRTNIPLNQVNEIIQILYKNNLIMCSEDKYKITTEGIKLLDKLGFSDLQISTLLNQTEFQPEEYSIYKSIFHEWRNNFTTTYLFIFNTIENEYENICKSLSHVFSSKSTGKTVLIASLLHKFSRILYTEESSNLMKYYNKLFEYSFVNHCLSSEIYHSTSKYWSQDKNYILLINHLNDSLNDFCGKTIHTLDKFDVAINNNYILLLGNHDINNINHDFSTSYNLLKHPELLSKIFTSQNIVELSGEFNWSEYQAKFILKCIRSKIDSLLLTEETDTVVISNNS